jgi:sortase A
MGDRSQLRKFRRRRQRAGFVGLMSLVIIVFGLTLLLRTEEEHPFQRRTSGEAAALMVERVAVPMISEAPQALSEKQATAEKKNDDPQNNNDAAAAGGGGGREEEEKNQQEASAAAAEEPVAPIPKTNDLWMTIPKMDLYDNYVSNSSDPAALDYGAAKRPDTQFPWHQGDTNTYIAAHRVGWPGTASYYQFYDLPNLTYGDKVYLYDANGTTYTYEVTEIFEVAPTETWVVEPAAGRDVISLQTCIENYGDYWTMGPNWYVRYVVRADRVAITPA